MLLSIHYQMYDMLSDHSIGAMIVSGHHTKTETTVLRIASYSTLA